jgi:hypothetical protein
MPKKKVTSTSGFVMKNYYINLAILVVLMVCAIVFAYMMGFNTAMGASASYTWAG